MPRIPDMSDKTSKVTGSSMRYNSRKVKDEENTKGKYSDNSNVNQNYTPPRYEETAFHCPHCNVYAHQNWYDICYADSYLDPWSNKISFCSHCCEHSVWINKQMCHPHLSAAPLAIAEMPESVKDLYNEARDIINRSPRGACALLRLAIQLLVKKELGENEGNLNQAISNLVQKGLPQGIQKALDTVRVVGNNAVHPGVININDNPNIANSLFKLVNIICEKMIKEPQDIDNLFDSLPDGQKTAISKRDQEKNTHI